MYDAQTPSGWHTTNLYTCLTSFDDSREFFERFPHKAKGMLKAKLEVFLDGGVPWHHEAFHAFLQGSLTAAINDIRWGKVKEGGDDLTQFEQLAAELQLGNYSAWMLSGMIDWIQTPRIRVANNSLLSVFCQKASRMIVDLIDWEQLEKGLRG